MLTLFKMFAAFAADPESQFISQILTAYLVFVSIFALLALCLAIFNIVSFWKALEKAGYSGALALLIFVPLGSTIVLGMLGFGKWPVLEELNYLRQQVGSRSPNTYYPAPQPPYYQ